LLITIDQIRYAAESNILKDKSLGRILCEQLIATLYDIEGYAMKSCKNENVLFDWYFCDVVGSVTYLAKIEKKDFVSCDLILSIIFNQMTKIYVMKLICGFNLY